MAVIQELSPQLANLIAAGEVVERPASAAKELIENAIDAGATRISVEIQNGGIRYLRVTDDGCGMSPEDAPVAFRRHATSKLHSEQELSGIRTLGFRGEALAAIVAVSRVDLLTRPADAIVGLHLHLEAGELIVREDAGCPKGTTIIVRDLFFNTPARMKFLKRDFTEAGYILSAVQHAALSHPEIAFSLQRDGKPVFATDGKGKLSTPVFAVFGKEMMPNMLEVPLFPYQELSAYGFITKPHAGRSNRSMQYFFVNHRYIKSKVMQAALEEAYQNAMLNGKYPSGVIFLDVPLYEVDVNVHPAKLEVKFSQEKLVFNAVYGACKQALAAGDNIPLMTQAALLSRSSLREDNLTEQQERLGLEPGGKPEAEPTLEPGIDPGIESGIGAGIEPGPKSESSPQPEPAPPSVEHAPPPMEEFFQDVYVSVPKKTDWGQSLPFASPTSYTRTISPTRPLPSELLRRSDPQLLIDIPDLPDLPDLSDPPDLSDTPDTLDQLNPLNPLDPFGQPAQPVPSDSFDQRDQVAYTGDPLIDAAPVDDAAAEGVSAMDAVDAMDPIDPVQTAGQGSAPIDTRPDGPDTRTDSLRVIGECFQTYLIAEDQNGLLFLDKHAAHERILFNQLKAETQIPQQELLEPVVVELTGEETAAIAARLPDIRDVGFAIEPFGETSFVIRSVPAYLDSGDVPHVITELASKAMRHRAVTPDQLDDFLHTVACRAAIKAGSASRPLEWQDLCRRVVQDDAIRSCPHGRPVLVRLTRYELDKLFKRVHS